MGAVHMMHPDLQADAGLPGVVLVLRLYMYLRKQSAPEMAASCKCHAKLQTEIVLTAFHSAGPAVLLLLLLKWQPVVTVVCLAHWTPVFLPALQALLFLVPALPPCTSSHLVCGVLLQEEVCSNHALGSGQHEHLRMSVLTSDDEVLLWQMTSCSSSCAH